MPESLQPSHRGIVIKIWESHHQKALKWISTKVNRPVAKPLPQKKRQHNWRFLLSHVEELARPILL